MERGVVGTVLGEEPLGAAQLRVGQQHRQFGNGEPGFGGTALGDSFGIGKGFERAVETGRLLEVGDIAGVDVEHRGREVHRVDERAVLSDVVAQHVSRDVGGHLREQCVALLDREVAIADDVVEEDLEVHLVIAGVDSCGVVDGIGVDEPATAGELDSGPLGEAEVPAFADHEAAQPVGVGPERIIRAVAGIGVGLGAGFHIRADAAVPEQVDGRHQDRMDESGGRQRKTATGMFDPERIAGGRRHVDGLRRAREDPSTLGQHRSVEVVPRGARQCEQALPFSERSGRIRRRVEKDVAVIERGDEVRRVRQEHAVAEDVAGHVADADRRERFGVRTPESVQVHLHRLPRPAGGDAHGLVVVPDGATRREGVAQPEAPCRRDLVGDVGERRRALVRGDDEIGIVPIVADGLPRGDDRAVDEVVGEIEQCADEEPVAGDDFVLHLLTVGR